MGLEVDWGFVKSIRDIKEFYSHMDSDIVAIEESNWDSFGEPNKMVYGVDSQNKIHGVANNYVNGKLFSQKLYRHGQTTGTLIYYGVSGEPMSFRLSSRVLGDLSWGEMKLRNIPD